MSVINQGDSSAAFQPSGRFDYSLNCTVPGQCTIIPEVKNIINRLNQNRN